MDILSEIARKYAWNRFLYNWACFDLLVFPLIELLCFSKHMMAISQV